MPQTQQRPVFLLLKQSLKRRPRLARLIYMIRAFWWLGPWRELFIRYYQRHSRNPVLVRNQKSLFNDLNSKAAIESLNREGYALGIQVPEPEISKLVSICKQQDVHSNPHLYCPTVRDIAHDPKLLEVVTGYFGVEPVLFSSNLYWTWPPSDEGKRQQAMRLKSQFHYDVGDFKTLVVFVYLTDVDENSGPHVLITGTHGQKPPTRLLSRFLNDRNAYGEFGDRVKVITGQRGTGFFEDLTCYHKHSVGNKARLILTICYLLQRKPLNA